MNTKEDIKQMMIDVRKAHRLIYQFQDRMLQLMKLIANTYDLSNPAGRKRFSNPVSIMRRGSDYPEANLKVYDKWAWDMLYTYEFEYYFGKSIRNNIAGCLSIFQIADNGYYLADGCFREQKQTDDHISKKEIKNYWPSEQSASYLLFSFECFPESQHRYYFKHPKESVVSLFGGKSDFLFQKHNGNVLIAKRYCIEEFFTRTSINDILKEFADLVKEYSKFSLIE